MTNIAEKILYIASRPELWDVETPDYVEIARQMKINGVYKTKSLLVSRDYVYAVTKYVDFIKEVKKCLIKNP